MKNGVEGLQLVDRNFIRRMEPEIEAQCALYSPETGIIEAETLVRTLARIASDRGAHLLTDTPLIGADFTNGVVALNTPRRVSPRTHCYQFRRPLCRCWSLGCLVLNRHYNLPLPR
jgi:L-2-hydroxyglutarate oxidase LhgO